MIPPYPVAFWHYFDYISMSALAVMISLLMITHRRKYGALESTISQTIAKRQFSRVVFSVVMTIFFPLYYAFLYFWVGPLTQMPTIFYVILLFSALCELIFVWMPAAGNTEEIHKITTGLVSFGMTALTLLIIVYGNGLHLIDYIATICFILISAFTAYVVLFKKLKHYTFTIEVTYCVLFVVALTIIAHS